MSSTTGYLVPSPAAMRVGMQLWRIGVGAPLVIALRVSQLAAAGWAPAARDRRETQRMVAEKTEAATQSWSAMAAAAAASTTTLATSLPLAWVDPAATGRVAAASMRTLEHGLDPFDRRVQANGRRLSSASRRRKKP